MIGAIGDVVYIDKIIKAIKNYLKKFNITNCSNHTNHELFIIIMFHILILN